MIYDIHIFVCTNERKGNERLSCGEKHGLELVAEFKKQLKDLKVNLKIRANKSGCLGICDFGPTVVIYPEGTFYLNVKIEDIKEIIDSHILNKIPVTRLYSIKMNELQINTSLLEHDLFELFRLQLKKDFEVSACDASFTDNLPKDFYLLRDLIYKNLCQLGISASSKLPGLLYRIDVSEKQIKIQCNKNPNAKWEENVAELIIKRILQKVILKKTYSKK